MSENLFQMMAGFVYQLAELNIPLIGGHSSEGELAMGVVANGTIEAGQSLAKKGAEAGDVIIMTKQLGTGTLFAAEMKLKTRGRWIDSAIDSMLSSNQLAASIIQKNSPTACTDITGFGLVGHLLEILTASKAHAQLDIDQLPSLPGALETCKQGLFSSLHNKNALAEQFISNYMSFSTHEKYLLLFDPQTSGGLLTTLSPDNAQNCVRELKSQGIEATIIGRITPPSDRTDQMIELK